MIGIVSLFGISSEGRQTQDARPWVLPADDI